jgi:hypothetical protein
MTIQNSIRTRLTWLYPLFAFLLPLQTRWIVRDAPVGDSVWEYGRVSVYGFDVVLVLINLLILFIYLRQRTIVIPAEAGIQKEKQKENEFCLFLFSGE